MRRDALIVLAVLIPVIGCNRQPAPAGPAAANPAASPTVVKPEMRPVKRVVEQPGTVQAFEETALLANLSGYVNVLEEDPDKKDRAPHDRFIDIGSRVKKDQVLARLTVPELEEEYKQKQALVKQAEAEVAQSEKAHAAAAAGVVAATAMVAESDAGVERAQALYDRWQSEVDRVTKLLADGVDVRQTLDETRSQLKAAGASRKEALARVASSNAAVKKAEADRDKASADIDAAKARLDVARTEVNRVDALRGYTRIRAPFDGVVTSRAVNRGDFVKAGDRIPLFSVARIDPVRVVVKVPETDAGVVAVGQSVRLTLQGAGSDEVGKVTRTSWSLEAGSRTMRTEIDLANEKGQIRPGTYAYARLSAELPAAWAVPAAAIGKVNDETVIYLVENGKAVRAAVQLLAGDGQFTQVRRYKKPGASQWTDVTGTESFVSPATAITDGQVVP